MTPGIFESVFNRPTLAETFAAVGGAGFRSVQFDLASADVDPWAGPVPGTALVAARKSADAAGVRIAAVSGTFNMAHPDPDARSRGLEGFSRVAEQAGRLGASFVTLCTGTRDTNSMWRRHADNRTLAAWADMVASITQALDVAARHDLVLVVEPEPANIVSSAGAARQLLDQFGSERLRIVLDPANIVLSDRTRPPDAVLAESFELLGPDIVFAHAKDLSADGEFCAAGSGIVPWAVYWSLMEEFGYTGDVIFHTLTEGDVPRALALFPPG